MLSFPLVGPLGCGRLERKYYVRMFGLLPTNGTDLFSFCNDIINCRYFLEDLNLERSVLSVLCNNWMKVVE